MVKKINVNKILNRTPVKATPVGMMGGEPLILPNYSGTKKFMDERSGIGYLKLDCSNDPLTGDLTTNTLNIFPSNATTYPSILIQQILTNTPSNDGGASILMDNTVTMNTGSLVSAYAVSSISQLWRLKIIPYFKIF